MGIYEGYYYVIKEIISLKGVACSAICRPIKTYYTTLGLTYVIVHRDGPYWRHFTQKDWVKKNARDNRPIPETFDEEMADFEDQERYHRESEERDVCVDQDGLGVIRSLNDEIIFTDIPAYGKEGWFVIRKNCQKVITY